MRSSIQSLILLFATSIDAVPFAPGMRTSPKHLISPLKPGYNTSVGHITESVDADGIKHVWDSSWPVLDNLIQCPLFRSGSATYTPSPSLLLQAVNDTSPGYLYYPGKCHPFSHYDECFGAVRGGWDGSALVVMYHRNMRIEVTGRDRLGRERVGEVRKYSFVMAISVLVRRMKKMIDLMLMRY